MFKQQLGVLRGTDTPLHRLIAAAKDVDDARHDSPVRLAASYQRLASTVGRVVFSETEPSADYRRGHRGQPAKMATDDAAVSAEVAEEALHRACGIFTELSQPDPLARTSGVVLTSAWFNRADALILGSDDAPALLHWLRFLGMTDGLPGGRLELVVREAFSRWRLATEAFVASADVVTSDELPGLERSSERLAPLEMALVAAFATTAWPERQLVAALVRHASVRREEIVAEARSTARACERLRDLLAGARESTVVVALQDSRFVAEVPLISVRQAYGYLVDRHRYRDARRFRRMVAHRVRLPSLLTLLWPLFAAVSAGTLLVLDVGTEWRVTLEGRPIAYWSTVLAAHASSFLLLVASLAARVGDAGRGGSALRRFARLALRVSWLYAGVVLLALTVSSLVLLTLQGSKVVSDSAFGWQALLWGSLSLFLGVFLGLILQGRGVMQQSS